LATLHVAQFPSIGRAISKNGSLWAYVFAGLGLALIPAGLLALLLPGLRRLPPVRAG
jgi:hypothetical protein